MLSCRSYHEANFMIIEVKTSIRSRAGHRNGREDDWGFSLGTSEPVRDVTEDYQAPESSDNQTCCREYRLGQGSVWLHQLAPDEEAYQPSCKGYQVIPPWDVICEPFLHASDKRGRTD